MNKDLTTLYAILSAIVGALFGIETGVFFCAVAGSLLAVRFCSAKGTLERFVHFAISVIFACIIVGETAKIYPPWLTLKLSAAGWGFLFLLLAELVYLFLKSVQSVNLADKISLILDRVIDKWTR